MQHTKRPRIVCYFATWCGPSQAFRSVLERARDAYGDEYPPIEYHDVDETDEAVMSKQKILGTPTTIIISKYDRELMRLVGYNRYDYVVSSLRKGVL